MIIDNVIHHIKMKLTTQTDIHNYQNSIEEQIKSKDYVLALQTCNEYLEDGDIKFYFLARIYFFLKKYKISKDYLLKIENNTLKDNKYYFLRGQIFEKLKNFEEAEKSFYVSVRKHPKNKKYIKKYIDYVRSQKNYEFAISKLEEIAKKRLDKDFYLKIEIAKYKVFNKEYKTSFLILKDLESRLDSDLDAINLVYASIYESIGDYENALLYNEKIKSFNIESEFKKNDLRFFLNRERENLVDKIYNFDLFFRNKNLTIVLSPLPNKFILRGYDFKTSVLYINEKFFSYYTYDYLNLIEYIIDIVNINQFDYINLTGSSKGSFAAINLGIGLGDRLKNKKINVVAFSPQAFIYPLNKDIRGLPSYKMLLNKSNESVSFLEDLKMFGNPIKRIDEVDIKVNIIYGSDHERDGIEAEKYIGVKNVTLKPLLDYPFHTSILMYTKKGDSLVKALSNKTAAANKDDQFFKPENNDVLVNQILNNIHKYDLDLNDLLLN